METIAVRAARDPYARHLGITVDTVEEGFASCSVKIGRDLCNFLGMAHGGLVFSLADVAFSAASNRDHYPSYALDISGSYLKTAAEGDILRAEARLVHSTRRTGLYRMDVFRGNELMATFNGTVFRKASSGSCG